MFAAVKSETAQYHRHVVSLEGMRGAEGQGLSLRQMAAWLQEPAFKLRHLVEWCRLSRGCCSMPDPHREAYFFPSVNFRAAGRSSSLAAKQLS
jgi:hypothetical protein